MRSLSSVALPQADGGYYGTPDGGGKALITMIERATILATRLGLERTTLQSKLQRLGIKRPSF
jgi:hypothetical protein